MSPAEQWTFFIAHPSTERATAEALYEQLVAAGCSAFLDVRSVGLGEEWDLAIAKAMRSSLVFVVLVAREFERAYYLREEVAIVIARAREPGTERRVVPVYLDGRPGDLDGVPYGLHLKNGVELKRDDSAGLRRLAERLVELSRSLGAATAAAAGTPPMSVTPAAPASSASGGGSSADELFDALCALLPAQFDEVVFRLHVTPAYLSPRVAPQATRSVELSSSRSSRVERAWMGSPR